MSKTGASTPPPLPWEQALDLILSTTAVSSRADVAIDGVLGLVCAGEVASTIAVPPFDNSSMDGFAVRAENVSSATAESPVLLKVIGEAPAGAPFQGVVGAGEAVSIMTGAPMPADADAVVRVEDTSRPSTDQVSIGAAVKAGTALRRAGADTQPGEVVIRAGSVLTAAHLALAASCGIATLPIYPRPCIALAVGGDEVVPVSADHELKPGEIFDSNSPMLLALFRSWAQPVEFLGRMPDDPTAMVDFLQRGQAFDMLITVGGVSMGERDYIRPCLRDIGGTEHFWRINQQPGGPMLYAQMGRTQVFGLPGNPVSSYVCADIYVQAALRKACGIEKSKPQRLRAVLADGLKKPHSKIAFIRCNLQFREGNFFATSTGGQDSNRIRSLVDHDGYILFPEAARELNAGDQVEVLITNPAGLGRRILNE